MDKFGAVLHHPWKAGEKPGEVIGCWAEDMHPYTMDVPHQLRDDIITLQNALCKRYAEIDVLRRKLSNLEHDAEKFLLE